MKNRIIVIMLVFAMTLSLAACGAASTSATAGTTAGTTAGATTAGATAAATTGAATTGGAVKEVKIGALFPFSGGSARMGELQKAGIELAVKNKNAAGGIKSMGGAQIKVIWADSTGQPEVGVTEMERLIVKEKVDCLLGPYNSSVGASTAPVADRYKVPYILTNSNVDTILENPYTYVFRANHANSASAQNMIEFLDGIGTKTGKKVKTAAIVYENSDWGKGMSQVIPDLAKAKNIEIVANEGFTTNAADLSNIVIKLKNLNPDVVFTMCYLNDALLFTNTMAEYQVNSAIVADGGGFAVPDYLEKAGSRGNNVIVAVGWHEGVLNYKPAESKALNEQYKKEFSKGVDMDEFSASGWLNASVMINALERAGSTDKEKIREALAATDLKADAPELALHAFQGIKFTKHGKMINQNPYAGKMIVQAINGKMVMVGPLNMVTDSKYVWPVPEISKR